MYNSAVQEERQRVKEKGESEVESTSGANNDMPVERILEAELAVEPKIDTYIDTQVSVFCQGCKWVLEERVLNLRVVHERKRKTVHSIMYLLLEIYVRLALSYGFFNFSYIKICCTMIKYSFKIANTFKIEQLFLKI